MKADETELFEPQKLPRGGVSHAEPQSWLEKLRDQRAIRRTRDQLAQLEKILTPKKLKNKVAQEKESERVTGLTQEKDRYEALWKAVTQHESREAKAYAVAEIQSHKTAFEYSIDSPLYVLLSWTGTFWPLVVTRYELYIFPLVHTALIYYMSTRKDEDGGAFWGDDAYMLPWGALTLLTPLMIFFLVFFLSQCYTRFTDFFNTSMAIESSVQDLTMLMLTHATQKEQVKYRWQAVRYLSAAAIVIYSRVTKLADGKDSQMNVENWGRLLKTEREWQSEGGRTVGEEEWERLMGWPRGRVEAKVFTDALKEAHDLNGQISADMPERKSVCPPLLTRPEVNRLRCYPGGMVSLVLCTWAMQTVVASNIDRVGMGAAQNAIMKLKDAAYRLRNQLGMPVPMPYFHSLTMLQSNMRRACPNLVLHWPVCLRFAIPALRAVLLIMSCNLAPADINFAIYSYALCEFKSYTTPIVLFVVILITVGMREVGVALSNPYGKDDVDFPVNKWIVGQLRSMALIVHQKNTVCQCPSLKKYKDLASAVESERGSLNEDTGESDSDGTPGTAPVLV